MKRKIDYIIFVPLDIVADTSSIYFPAFNRIPHRQQTILKKVIHLCITVIKRRLKKKADFYFECHKIAQRTIDAMRWILLLFRLFCRQKFSNNFCGMAAQNLTKATIVKWMRPNCKAVIIL